MSEKFKLVNCKNTHTHKPTFHSSKYNFILEIAQWVLRVVLRLSLSLERSHQTLSFQSQVLFRKYLGNVFFLFISNKNINVENL